jgi:CelD/BcsL family acetyltransferase involved in cellulose biosynthesis
MTSTAETATSARAPRVASAAAISSTVLDGDVNLSIGGLRDLLSDDEQAWLELAARAGAQFPGLLFEWHNAWATTARAELVSDARVIRAVDETGTLIGILPFAISGHSRRLLAAHRLEWPLQDLGCPDHFDVPILSMPAATGIVSALHELEWDVVHLESLSDDAPGAQRLAAALAARGCRVEWVPGELCPYIALPNSWDSYLASLSPTRRQTIRRKERALFREHAVTIVDYAANRLDEGWAHLLRLHRQQRQHDTAFGPEAAELQRAFAASLVRRDRVWLTSLDVGGTPVAAWYGFALGNTMCFYQCGRDPAWEHASVGQVLMGVMIRRAIEGGFRTFDFLRGDEPYKMTWTSTLRRDRALVAYRRGFRGALVRWNDALLRTASQARRAFRARRGQGAGSRS